jgi:hypothetical protein
MKHYLFPYIQAGFEPGPVNLFYQADAMTTATHHYTRTSLLIKFVFEMS